MDHGVAYWKKLLPRRASKRGCTCRLTSTALCRQRPLPIFTYSTVSLFSRGAATNAVPCSYFDLVLDLLSCNLAHSVALTQNGREATADDIRRACLIRLSAIPPLAALAHNPRFPCSFSTKVCGEIASATPRTHATTAAIGRLFSTVSKTHDAKHGSEPNDGYWASFICTPKDSYVYGFLPAYHAHLFCENQSCRDCQITCYQRTISLWRSLLHWNYPGDARSPRVSVRGVASLSVLQSREV